MNNSHVLSMDGLKPETKKSIDEAIKKADDFGGFSEGVRSFEEFIAEVKKPVPWYERWFNFVVYGIPWRIQEAWWSTRDFYQRGRNGYAHADVWNLYEYLADVITKSTKELAETGHGYPPYTTEEDWKRDLMIISEAFANVEKIEEEGRFPEDEDVKKLDEAFDLLKKHFFYMWD